METSTLVQHAQQLGVIRRRSPNEAAVIHSEIPLFEQCIGSGWNAMTALTALGDLNSDLNPDIVARDSSGTLWTYPGTGGPALRPRVKMGGGWNAMKLIV